MPLQSGSMADTRLQDIMHGIVIKHPINKGYFAHRMYSSFKGYCYPRTLHYHDICDATDVAKIPISANNLISAISQLIK